MRRSSYLMMAVLVMASCGSPRRAADAAAAEDAKAQARLIRQSTDAVIWQSTSAEAHRLFQQGYELARLRLAENMQRLYDQSEQDTIAAASRPVPAVIVDIDETVLDNSPYQIHLVNNERMYEPVSWKAWTAKAEAKALPGALEFLLHAAEQGCEVYYITNREVDERESTLKNLTDLGFPFADNDHLLLMDGPSDKTARRAHVSERHPVVLLVGDQLRDLDERFKDRSVNYGKDQVDLMADTLSRYFILLPNPMYGTYMDAVRGTGTPEEKRKRVKKFFSKHSY